MDIQYEKERLDALHSLNILDTSPDERLDALTKEVQAEFDCKTCLA